MKGQKGAALIEFALIALTVYLLLAASIEFGRMIFVSQTLQDASRLAARELALTPLPAGCTFEEALAYPNLPVADANCPSTPDPDCSQSPNVPCRVWDPARLVVDITCAPTDTEFQNFMNNLPVVNQALRPVMIYETNNGRKLLRYPGALLAVPGQTFSPGGACPANANDLTVGIPRVTGRDPITGVETIKWVPVLGEVVPNEADPSSGPFSLLSTGPQKGLVAVAINYPFQSAMLSLFQRDPVDPLKPNLSAVVVANDGAVQTDPSSGPAPGTPVAGGTDQPTYSGQYGLGGQYALNNTNDPSRAVRPYRKLLLGQAIFRREVVQ
jgi:hypothetical protein